MKYLNSLLRKEFFGGTLFNAVSNKRLYINHDECAIINVLGHLPRSLVSELNVSNNRVTIVEPSFLPNDNFSAPDKMFLEITRACNLTCTHCFNDSGKKMSEELSREQIIKTLDDACQAGVQELRFTGGEPLIVKHIYDYISIVRDYDVRVSIGTNGAIVNQAMAEKLAAVDLNTAIVSVDGLEDQHDLIRGRGTFHKTLAGIDYLIKAGIAVRVNTVVMKSNMEQIFPIAKFFFERHIPLMIRRLIPAGRADGMKQEMLTNEDYAKLREELGYFLNHPDNLLTGHYLKEEPFIPRIELPFRVQSCSAGHRGLVILPNGKVQTCGFLGPLGEVSLGNVATENLQLIWKRLTNSDHIANFRDLLPVYNASTKHVCTNCLAIAYADTNSDHSKNTVTKGGL